MSGFVGSSGKYDTAFMFSVEEILPPRKLWLYLSVKVIFLEINPVSLGIVYGLILLDLLISTIGEDSCRFKVVLRMGVSLRSRAPMLCCLSIFPRYGFIGNVVAEFAAFRILAKEIVEASIFKGEGITFISIGTISNVGLVIVQLFDGRLFDVLIIVTLTSADGIRNGWIGVLELLR